MQVGIAPLDIKQWIEKQLPETTHAQLAHF